MPMKIIPRVASKTIVSLAREYPAVVIIGPRQSGKTTLARAAFPNKPYVSMEDLDLREFATADPRGFLSQYSQGAILDEVQRCPDMFSYLQTHLDCHEKMGQFILTGSQQLGLMANITQSLAGRVAIVTLLPFSLYELQQAQQAPKKIEKLLYQGMYPPVHNRKSNPSVWYSNYVATYLEREVRQMVNVRSLDVFRRFIKMCAARTGLLLNLSALGGDCGITYNTAKEWVSILEASFIIFLLQPYHKNFNKRLIKTPKLYFCDHGLAAWLLNIENTEQLVASPVRGQLFETFVATELLKHRYNQSLPSNLYFWRDRAGNEIDIVIERGERLVPVEIKSGQTVATDFLDQLDKFVGLAGDIIAEPTLVYGGKQAQTRHGTSIVPWQEVSKLLTPASRD